MATPIETYLTALKIRHEHEAQQAVQKEAQDQLKFHQKQLDETVKEYERAHDIALQGMGLHKALVSAQMEEHYSQLFSEHPGMVPEDTKSISPEGQRQVQPMGQQGMEIPGITPDMSSSPQSNISTSNPNASLSLQSPRNFLATPQNSNIPEEVAKLFPQGGVTVDPNMNQEQIAASVAKQKALGDQILSLQKQSTETLGPLQAKFAGQTKSAEEAAAEPYNITKANREHKLKMDEEIARGANESHVAEIHGRYGLAQANAHAAGQMAVAHMMMGGDENGANPAVKNMGDQVYSGILDSTKIPTKLRPSIDSYVSKIGGVIPDYKQLSTTLTDASSAEEVLKLGLELANDYSTDSPKGGKISGSLQQILPGGLPFSDLKSKMDTFKAMGGKLATTFDEQKRKSDAEIIRQVLGAFNPTANKTQNLSKLNDHIKILNARILAALPGMNETQKAKVLGDHGISLFGMTGESHGQSNSSVPFGSSNTTNVIPPEIQNHPAFKGKKILSVTPVQ